jgi:hypothetical protein
LISVKGGQSTANLPQKGTKRAREFSDPLRDFREGTINSLVEQTGSGHLPEVGPDVVSQRHQQSATLPSFGIDIIPCTIFLANMSPIFA